MSGPDANHDLEDLRGVARRIWEAGLAAADPAAAVARSLAERPFQPRTSWELLAVGKAAGAMARAALDRIGALPREGLVVTEATQVPEVEAALGISAALETSEAGGLRVLPGGHPLPDRDSELAGRAAEELIAGPRSARRAGERSARRAGDRSQLLVLLSGGGSALLVAPSEGLSLAEKIEATSLLLAAGADIHELNCVRRHLSRTKGGGLGRLAAGREVRVLVLSDVLGDRLEDVASGPFYGDPTSFADALEVARRHRLGPRLPAAILRRLESGARGELEENPRPEELRWIEHRIVGSLELTVDAAVACAQELGAEPVRLPSWLTGEARIAGARLVDSALAESARRRRLGPRPLAIVGGGETVVTVTGDGVGGRAQELALGFAAAAEDRLEGPWALLVAGTDGRDGPGEAAGGLVDSGTLERARALDFEVDEILARNDSSRLLRATRDLLVTGPTGTNVGDLTVLLIGAAQRDLEALGPAGSRPAVPGRSDPARLSAPAASRDRVTSVRGTRYSRPLARTDRWREIEE
ncbi:MAG TPA: DUF4147 domain-containing protein [Thermoanaerobaculia bacterium]|nr:DUF4147 domain-containing protein [Thermoanaerobaculia bacterium]